MKKCVSCTKDLPDTAMHCVFCGAKQPALPAPGPVQSANPQAKTVMGYQAADVLKAVQAQQGGHAAPPQGFPQAPPPQAPPPQAPPPQGFPQAPPPQFGQPQGFPPPGPPPNAFGGPTAHGGFNAPPQAPAFAPPPAAPQGGQFGGSANAATVFMQGPAQPPAPAPQQPPQQGGGYSPQPMGHGPQMGGPMSGAPQPMGGGYPQQPMGGGGPQAGGPQGYNPQPVGGGGYSPQPMGGGGYNPQPVGGGYNPQPVGGGYNPQPMGARPPYLASQTAARSGAPIEPYADVIKIVLLVFGLLTLVAFNTPQIQPDLRFPFQDIIDAAGKAKIPYLLIAATGLLGLVMALIPLTNVARGTMAALLGVIPVATLLALGISVSFEWRNLVTFVGFLTLVPGLLLRNEYRDAMLPRLLVTIGVVCVLLPDLIPVAGNIPLVENFKALGDAKGKLIVVAILELVPYVLALVSLLAWLPGPGTAGATVIAWLWILVPLIVAYAALLVSGHLGDVLKSDLRVLTRMLPQMAWMAFAGYGLATLLGKNLESG